MLRTIVVREYERGLQYRRGRFERVLEAGQYRLWSFGGRDIVKVDVREQALQVAGQEVLTADNVALRLNILVRYRVADPARAMHEVASYLDALHQAAQLAARELIAARELADVLGQRTELSEALTEATAARAAQFGVAVATVAIKDASPSAELKAAYQAKVMAQEKGEAALIEARNEVAVARARANAARILADNPALMAQRQLDILERAAANGYGNHFLVVPESVGKLVRKLAGDERPEQE